MSAERVYLLGEGALFHAVRALVGEHPRTVIVQSIADLASAASCGLLVSVHEGWRDERELAIQRACRGAGVKLLHCRLDGPLGVVGPLVSPSGPGCIACAERRRRIIATLPASDIRALQPGAGQAPPWVLALAQLIASLVAQYLAGRLDVRDRIFVLQGSDMAGQWHTAHPIPNCEECGQIPADSREAAEVRRQPRAQEDPEKLRVRRMWLSTEELRQALMDWRYGLVTHVFRVNRSPIALSGAEFPVSDAGYIETGWGRASTYRSSELVAFLEALERYASMSPRGKRTVVRGTQRELADDAIDPTRLGLPDPEVIESPDTRLVAYRPDLELSWVWGYSFTRARPVLVPEQFAYYRHRVLEESPRLVDENSNGAALGSCIEEAVLYGILEILERDAFLLAWYGRLPVRELLIDELDDPEIDFLILRLHARGYRVHFFDITSEVGVPAVWSLAVSERDGQPMTYSAASCHPNPAQAVLSALSEVVPNVYFFARRDHHTDESLREMLTSPDKVRQLEDHVAMYTIPEALERLSFLLRPERERVPIGEAFPDWRARWMRDDLDQSLELLVQRLNREGLEVIAVDTTTPEQRTLDLCCTKVLIPGMLPMTFGHHNRRTYGLPRLLEVPARLGYWSAPKRYEELELFPHPFP